VHERNLSDRDDSLSSAPPTVSAEVGRPRALSEQKAAFTEFYRAFAPTLVAFLIWYGASVDLAVDVAQDTMRKAWERWSTIVHPEAWARRTAGRALVRYRVETRETPVDEVLASSLISNPDAISEMVQSHTVIRLLDELPPRQRQVLALTLAGYAPAEIADELGITPEAVRASLMKARRRIAEMLRREEEHDHDA
jgi:RNA polymerase sigma factor (sigma-70 family)